MARFDDLPTELIVLIVEYVSYYKSIQQRQREDGLTLKESSSMGLRSLRRVSHRFCELTAPSAFRRIVLRDDIDSAATQALGLSESRLARHVRRLVLPSACAMPTKVISRLKEWNSLYDPNDDGVFFRMRKADAAMFPRFIFALFRAVGNNLTSLKLHIAEVMVAMPGHMDYPILYARTVAYALRNINLPVLKDLRISMPQCTRENIYVTELLPLMTSVSDPLRVIPGSLLKQMYEAEFTTPCARLRNVSTLRLKLGRENKNAYGHEELDVGAVLLHGVQCNTFEALEELMIKLEGFNCLMPRPIAFPSAKLRKLSIQGQVNMFAPMALLETLNNCVNLEHLHLRGVFTTCEVPPGPEDSWAPVFQKCSSKESLISVCFEVLGNSFHYQQSITTMDPGLFIQGVSFPEVERIRARLYDDDKETYPSVWIDEYCMWRPLITETQPELDALEDMRQSMIAKRILHGLPPSKWLEVCGMPLCRVRTGWTAGVADEG